MALTFPVWNAPSRGNVHFAKNALKTAHNAETTGDGGLYKLNTNTKKIVLLNFKLLYLLHLLCVMVTFGTIIFHEKPEILI